MGRKVLLVAVATVFLLGAVGCMAHIHTIGAGSRGAGFGSARQWYALWGLVPINNVDSKAMAGDAVDYTVKTWVSPLDFLINIFTGYVTIYSRTVEVRR